MENHLKNICLFEREFMITNNKKPKCYAPFTSMLFDQQGRIMSCYSNCTHILGTYPKNSIKECWFGNKAEELRNALSNNDYSKGCFICMYLSNINDNISYSSSYKRYDEKVNFNFTNKIKNLIKYKSSIGYPKELSFTISNTCNLECTMCDGYFSSSIRSNIEKLPKFENPYDENFFEELKEFIPELETAKFGGGEPFLSDQNYKIWDMIYELNPTISLEVTTNGTILTNRVKTYLEKLNFNLFVSIDSIEKDNYEKIRKNASFENVMKNLDYFIDYTNNRKTNLFINCCPMQQNWDEIPNFVEFCNMKNIYIYFPVTYKPIESSLSTLSADKLAEIINFWSKQKLSQNNDIEKNNYTQFQNLIELIEHWREERLSEQNIWGSLTINEFLNCNLEEMPERNIRYYSSILARKKSSENIPEHYNLSTKESIDKNFNQISSQHSKKPPVDIIKEMKRK